MAGFNLPEEDILLHLDVADSQEALSIVCAHLLEEGKVKEGYLESILAREQNYPTGLDLEGINVAIPHTDWEWSLTTQLVVATFAAPIPWANMEDPDETVQVSCMVLSLFDDPAHQIDALQKIMSVIQDQGTVARLVAAQDAREIADVFNSREEQ